MVRPSGQETLILEHLNLVRAIAVNVSRSIPRHVELDDLVQAGTLGLIDAANKFDLAQQTSFATYAKHRIRGAVLDSLRREDSLSRDLRIHQKKIQAAARQLEQEKQREATAQEIAAALGIEVRRLEEIRLRIHQGRTIQRDHPHDPEMPEIEVADRPEDRPDAILERGSLRIQVQAAMEALPERQRVILQLYYVEDLTMREIAGILGVNESRISQLHKRATEALAEHLRTPAPRGMSSVTPVRCAAA